MGKKIRQSEDELIGKLKEQVTLIRNSADLYDNGDEVEAINLAIRLRVLLHDSNRSKSLLGQLHRKQIDFSDSATEYPSCRSEVGHSDLTHMKMSTSDGISHVAPLDNDWKDKKSHFPDWWQKNVILVDELGNIYTRETLVLQVADTNGGAHVDTHLDETYAHLSRDSTLGLMAVRNGRKEDFRNRTVRPSIRQIAHEVLRTLKDEFPDI
jgi:hypothetical protein